MVDIKKILFPIDLTQNSAKILPYVVSASEKYNSSIYILHVVEDYHPFNSDQVEDIHPDHLDDCRQKALEEAEKTMDKVCEEQLEGCFLFEKKIVSGNPTLEILRTVESEDIDLVIMGTHGRKGIGHYLLMGSVAESVVRSSPVPVLTINPDKVKQQGHLGVNQQAA
jgi:nucleotide-binding universal stress UspA family protein